VLLTTRTRSIEAALTWATATASLAKGLQFAISALFFTTVVGLSPTTVGVGLTIGGAAGMASTFGAGYLADRVGSRRVLLGAAVAQSAALGAYCFVRTTVLFVVVACLAAGAQGAQRTAQSTLLARQFTGADRVQVRARLRVTTNVSIGVGSVVAAGALALGSPAAYLTAMIVSALLVLSSVTALRTLPDPRPEAHETARASDRSPLTDRRYLAVTALNAVMTIQFIVLTVGLPLWVTGHTRAPAATVSLLLVLNTVFVVLFQIRAARLVRDLHTAGRMVLIAAVALVVACGLYAASSHGPAVVAVALLVLAVLAQSTGEVLSEAGSWELAFELADPRSAGAYQGVSQTGMAVGTMLAPAVVTSTAVDHGLPGWILLAALFLAAGTGTLLIARRVR
jgi:predicted MFS family arabinose efflux permease